MQVLKLRPYDHPVYTTKHNNHGVILKTPLIRPPRYFGQEFTTQRRWH